MVDVRVLGTTTPLRAVLYGRASVDRNKRGRSVAAQIGLNRSVCERNGWVVVGEFGDTDRSASRHARLARNRYEDMIQMVKAGEVDIIVYCDAARGYRDLETFVALRRLCEDSGVYLCYNERVFDMRNAADRRHASMDAVEAEGESEEIRARILRTTRSQASLGKPHGRTPYGFRREYDPETGELIRQVPFKPEADLIREMARRTVSGDTNYKIAKDFNERGVATPSRQSSRWTPEMVKMTLLKPSNAGLRQFQGEVVGKANWDPIIDPDVYDKCDAILNSPARRNNKDSSVKWLLSGIAVGACGGTVRMRWNRGIESYQCVDDFCSSVRITKFDAIVTAEVLARMERLEFRDALQAASDESNDEPQRLRAHIADLKLTLAEATDAAANRQLSIIRLTEIEGKVQPQIEAAEAELRRMSSSVPQLVYDMAGPSAREVWAEMELPQRRSVLRAVTTLIRINKAAAKGARKITSDRYTIDFKW